MISVVARIIITIIVFAIIYKQKWHEKTLLVLLPIVLTFLDAVDNVYATYEEINLQCVLTKFHYYCDKFADAISYSFLFFLIKTDMMLSFFIGFRILGIVLFLMTANSVFLIFMFDFVKEYLLYLFLFNNNMKYLMGFVVLKFAFIIVINYVIKKHNEEHKNDILLSAPDTMIHNYSDDTLVAAKRGE